jgi:hypothetical protein
MEAGEGNLGKSEGPLAEISWQWNRYSSARTHSPSCGAAERDKATYQRSCTQETPAWPRPAGELLCCRASSRGS